MQKTVTTCLPAFQINRILIFVVQVKVGFVFHNQRSYGVSAVIVSGCETAFADGAVIVGKLVEFQGCVINSNRVGIDDFVVHINRSGTVAGQVHIVTIFNIPFGKAVIININNTAVDIVVDGITAAFGGAERQFKFFVFVRRYGKFGEAGRVHINGIVVDLAPAFRKNAMLLRVVTGGAEFYIVSGNKVVFSFGGKGQVLAVGGYGGACSGKLTVIRRKIIICCALIINSYAVVQEIGVNIADNACVYNSAERRRII